MSKLKVIVLKVIVLEALRLKAARDAGDGAGKNPEREAQKKKIKKEEERAALQREPPLPAKNGRKA